jgi:hypothetical protein
MRLIDILVRELPKRGGWPEGAVHAWADRGGEVRFRKGGCVPDFYPTLSVDFECRISDTHQEDDPRYIITREQYEAALKQSVWDGTGLPPVGVEFEYGTHRTRAKCLAIGHHMVFASKGDPDDEDGDFEEFMISIQDSEFHEVRSKRDEAVHTIAELCRSAASNGHSADLIYDAIAAGKITGVKLSD